MELNVSRVGTYAQHNSLVRQMTTIQSRLMDRQVQLASGYVSQDYAGISSSSLRLVSIEQEVTRLQMYQRTNAIANNRLETMSTAIDAVDNEVRDLRNMMLDFQGQNLGEPTVLYQEGTWNDVTKQLTSAVPLDDLEAGMQVRLQHPEAGVRYATVKDVTGGPPPDTITMEPDPNLPDGLNNITISFGRDISLEQYQQIDDLQIRAFEAMESIEFYLNARHNGRYLFAGGRTDTAPVSIPFNTLEDFQAVYDGDAVTYPQSRAAHLDNTQVTADMTLAPAVPSPATWAGGILTAGAATEFDTVNPGDILRLDDGTDVFFATVERVNHTTDQITFIDGSHLSAGPFDVAIANQVSVATADTFNDLRVDETTNDAISPPGSVVPGNLTLGTDFVTAAAGTFSSFEAGDVIRLEDGNNQSAFFTVDNVSTDGASLTFTGDPLTTHHGFSDPATIPATLANWTITKPKFPPGQIKLEDTEPYNGTYTVKDISADGTRLVLAEKTLASNYSFTSATVAPQIYYKGDDLIYRHRVDEDRTISLGITAKDAAFEKALRGLGLVAQGHLAVNPERVVQAITLLNDALNHDPANRSEDRSDMVSVGRLIGMNQVTINSIVEEHRTLETTLLNRAGAIENADPTEVATRLTEDMRALEISFASYARIMSLSLNNYLS